MKLLIILFLIYLCDSKYLSKEIKLKDNYSILLNKTFKEYNIITMKSDDPFKISIYKKDGSNKFKTINNKIKYKIEKYGEPSYINFKNIQNYEINVEIEWVNKEIILDKLSIFYTILSIITMYLTIFTNVKNIWMKIFLVILLTIEIINGDVQNLAVKFIKTVLRIK